MRTFSINTLGCKVNQYEGQQIRELLERRGLRQAEWPQEPDLVVVHTCCVTRTASAKSRQCIRKVLKQSPQSLVLVSGCLPAAQTGELSRLPESIHLVANRNDLAATLTLWAEDTAIKAKNEWEIKRKNEADSQPARPPAHGSELPLLTSFKQQTRAFLKIQDGCDGYCSYCIVPKTRPVVRSKSVETTLVEAQALVDAGHKEIVVSGVFLGAYGCDSVRRKNWPGQRNGNLADLLDRMAQIPGLARIRLSSLEPADVTERLLDVFCTHHNIMPHLHLALQSGSDAVLKGMCRQYRVDEFKRTVDSIQARLDRPAITTDIIIGFPGETDADFEQTFELARHVGFAKMHVFPFSARRGTAAANMQDRVETQVCQRRSQILRELDAELGSRYRRQFIGETADILIESFGAAQGESSLSGRSERYFRVYVDCPSESRISRAAGKIKDLAPGTPHGGSSKIESNMIVRVTLAKEYRDGLLGIPGRGPHGYTTGGLPASAE